MSLIVRIIVSMVQNCKIVDKLSTENLCKKRLVIYENAYLGTVFVSDNEMCICRIVGTFFIQFARWKKFLLP